ncbi:MAG: T9SS type A sorting domain-containing protein, partial [Bacteroidia bacterium]|nr:T9SS type A sorting domain-containing protein [Bacteroidia bacterium]
QEDARIDYTGDEIKATATSSTSTATITLRANILDITASPSDPNYDTYAGDIRNAKVMFVDRDNGNASISGWLPVSTLVNPADSKIGTVSYNWNVNIGSADYKFFTVGIIVDNGYYIRSTSDDNTVVTIYKPVGDFITGGGYIVPTLSIGSMKSDVGRKTNFGFNVKFNKKGNNLQGNMNIIFRRTESDNIVHVYQIKANAMQSLGVNATNATRQTAEYVSKTNITDITNPLSPSSLGGNKYLYVKMTDNGEPGNKDSISFVLVNGNDDPTVLNNIIYSSNWVASKTQQMNLSGGNLVVHSGFNLGGTEASKDALKAEVVETLNPNLPLNIKAYPNPSERFFNLFVESSNTETVHLKVYDLTGKLLYTTNGGANRTYRFGDGFISGVYIAEVQQGDKRKTVKLVKQQ